MCYASQSFRLSAGVAVKGKQVLGASGDAGENTPVSKLLDAAAHGLGVLGAFKGREVSSKTADMGSSHGGARHLSL